MPSSQQKGSIAMADLNKNGGASSSSSASSSQRPPPRPPALPYSKPVVDTVWKVLRCFVYRVFWSRYVRFF